MAFPTVAFLILIGVLLAWRARMRRWMWRGTKQDDADRCPCGYNLRGLTILRCPKCGRVIGFNATAEELTLSKEELERAAAVREQRRQGIR
jgi:hypothetical protein